MVLTTRTDIALVVMKLAVCSRFGRFATKHRTKEHALSRAAEAARPSAMVPDHSAARGLSTPARVRLGYKLIGSYESAIHAAKEQAGDYQAWTRCHLNGQSHSSRCKKASFARTSRKANGFGEPSSWAAAMRSAHTMWPISVQLGDAASTPFNSGTRRRHGSFATWCGSSSISATFTNIASRSPSTRQGADSYALSEAYSPKISRSLRRHLTAKTRHTQIAWTRPRTNARRGRELAA